MAAPIPPQQVPNHADNIALDDLFADDVKPAKSLIPSAAATLATMSDLSNPMVMLTFYRRLFPFKALFLWLNQDQAPSKNMTNREFSFTLQNDVYLRYKSFSTADELKKDVVLHNPSRFEIGPVYSARPKDRKTLLKTALKPLLRELVFDIDMTDYDEIRRCCQDKAMCKRCWRFISMAVKVIDRTLRQDFGYKHLLWVYSGRRGIHCWVSDPTACALSDDERRSIVNYIELVKGGSKMDKKVNLARPLHPSVQASYDLLKSGFDKVVLKDQDCFRQPEQWETVLSLLPDKEAVKNLSKKFADKPDASSTDRWSAVLNPDSKMSERALEKYKDAVADILIQYTYPRIDTEVSKKRNHLLKSPFCVHPGTGRVCVPLLPADAERFDPDLVPTVGQLLMELEEATNVGDAKAGWEKTSLRPYVELFERHVEGILKEAREAKRGVESMEF